MLCSAMGNAPKYAIENLTGCNPFNDSHDENGSVQWQRNILKVQSIMQYPTDVRNALMKRYTSTIIYTFLKDFDKMIECNYEVDLGPSLNLNAPADCFGNKKNTNVVFTRKDVSEMNIRWHYNTTYRGESTVINDSGCKKANLNVANFPINTISGQILKDNDGNDVTYWKNDAHENSGDPPYVRTRPVIDWNNPNIASKFMNGGKSNTDILYDTCITNGMSQNEALQHIQTINELYGSIPVVDTDEELEDIRNEIIARFNSNPIPNRKMDKTMRFNANEMLYYIVQRIDNELVVKSLLASQYILDNHGTAALIPALQKMYELFDSGIPDVVYEKKHEDINHHEVAAFIDTTCNEIIENLNRNLKVDTCLELTDEMMNDVKDNCSDALIKQFIGDTLTQLDEPQGSRTAPRENVVEDSSWNGPDTTVWRRIDDICEICQNPGAVPINIQDDNDDYCKHSFHPFCLANWALSTDCSNNDCCPTCRKSFRY